MNVNINEVVVFLSLALTPATIIMSLMVCVVWRKAAIDAIQDEEKTDLDWFIVGVFVGFLGSSIDNIYWCIAWSLDFIDSSYKDWFFEHGAWSNLPFRQACTTIAAACHLVAASHTSNKVLRAAASFSFVMTVIFLAALLMVKL